MLIIPVKEGENIDRALKRFKRKFLQTQVLKEIRQRKEFTKKSEKLIFPRYHQLNLIKKFRSQIKKDGVERLSKENVGISIFNFLPLS